MARQRALGPFQPQGKRPGGVFKGKARAAYDAEKMFQEKANQQAAKIIERDKLLSQMGIKNAPTDGVAQNVADFAVDARPHVIPGSLAAAGLVAGLKGASDLTAAYSDQSNEYLSTNPLAVVGRSISNYWTPQEGTVGLDPLAAARNSIAEAGKSAGTTSVLAAIADDEIASMNSRQEAMNAPSPAEFAELTGVQAMIDARAADLQTRVWEDASGNRRNFTPGEAQRIATEQVNMELRASNIY